MEGQERNFFDIQGKKAMITGGTRGLGYSMAEGLMEAGCETAIVGTSDKVFQVAEQFRQRGFQCRGVRADFAKRDEVYRGFQECVENLGGDLDILVNAHGIQRRHSAEEFPVEEWDMVLDVNLNSVFLLCQEAGKLMLKKGYRWGTGQDMKGPCIFLASHASDYLGGAIIPVDGGYLVK